jgi:hypothetical protein
VVPVLEKMLLSIGVDVDGARHNLLGAAYCRLNLRRKETNGSSSLADRPDSSRVVAQSRNVFPLVNVMAGSD